MKRWAAMVWLALALPAAGQSRPLLDLSAAPGAPAPGAGAAALALADALKSESEKVWAAGEGRAGARVRMEVRLLARALLTTGEAMGQAGSGRLMLGRTMAAVMPALDALAATDDPVLHAAAGDIVTARRAIEKGEGDTDLAVRDGLVLLSKVAGAPTPEAGVGGWVEDRQPAGSLRDRLEAWAAMPGVSPEAIEALRALEASGDEAAAFPALASGLMRMRSMVADAAAAMESAPAWVQEPTRRVLGEQFSRGVVSILRGEDRVAGLELLTRLAAVAEVVRLADAIEGGAAGNRVRSGVGAAVSIPMARSDTRTMEAAGELLRLVAERGQWPEEKRLMRQARPLYRVLLAAARQTEHHLMAVLPEVLRRPEAMTDPGVLAAITAHRRSVQDVRGLLAVQEAWAARGGREGSEPVPDKPWQSAANRMLKLSQELTGSRAEAKESAKASLRTLFVMVERCWTMPGEEDLRREVREGAGRPPAERTGVWTRTTGGREAALLSEIADRRAGWLAAWERSAGGTTMGSDGARLEALRSLMQMVHEAAPSLGDGGNGYDRLQAWPGWELSRASLAVLAAGLEEQTADATRLLLAGDAAKASETVEKARRDYATVRLAGVLSREATRRGIAPDRTPAGALRELTAGGPVKGRSWMGREVEWLDDVCRYGEEVAALRRLGAKDKADALQRFVNTRAAEVVERLERVRPDK